MTLDLPGHGSRANQRATFDEVVRLVTEVAPPRYVLGGYSMGGRLALHVALAQPEGLAGLILLGATRGIAEEGERAARRETDEARATRILELGGPAFIDEWLAQPMFRTLPADPRERAARSENAEGLAGALRDLGTGAQRWLGDEVAHISFPTLLLAGALDEKFLAEALAMSDVIPHARVQAITGAGHAAHLEQPSAVAEAVLNFIEALEREQDRHDQAHH